MSVLGQRPDVGEFRPRFKWIALAVVLLMSVLLVKLATMQIVEHGDYAQKARDNVVRRLSLSTSRGVIRDRNGVILAGGRESWDVRVIPYYLDFDSTWPKLAEILGLGPVERATLEQRLRQARVEEHERYRRDPKHKLKELLVREDVSRDVLAGLETHRRDLPAVSWSSVPVRWYPQKDLAFHLTGYVNEVTKEDIEAQGEEPEGPREARLREGDRVGRIGAERAFEQLLRGHRGWKKFVLDARGNRRTQPEDLALIDEPKEQPASPGRDLRLTIDTELMASARKAFTGQLAGSVVVVEVKTGRILALYSKPAVDPNDFVIGLSKHQAENILANPLRPLIDKTMFEAYFPGSTMKPFSALAALTSGAITERTQERCEHIYVLGRTRFKCEGFHGDILLHKALVHSCNIFFYHVGERAGIDSMANMSALFGLGQRTGLALDHEVAGLVPSKAWYNQHYGGQFRLGFTLNAAIGQGNTKITVLQLAMAYAALGNGGTLWEPQLIAAVERPVVADDGSVSTVVETEFAPKLRRHIDISPQHLRPVLEAMHGVVNEPGGTAYSERSTKVDLAGKTGTAQVSRVTQKSGIDPRSVWYLNRDHAWFGAFAPYQDPEIAVAVIVEHGGGGGHNAAPIAMRVMEDYFLRIKPGQTASHKSASVGGSR